MKKFLMVLALVGVVTVSAFAVNPTLTVSATVAQKLEVSTTGTGGGTFLLDIDNSGSEVLATGVNNIKVVSSQKAWTILITSENNGTLVATDSNTPITYQVKVDTTGFSGVALASNQLSGFVQLVSGGKTIIANTSGNGGKTSMDGVEFPVTVKVPSYLNDGFIQTVGAGTTTAYSDTITIAISAN